MLSSEEILQTIRMLREEHLDIRTVTMGISLRDCASGSAAQIAKAVYNKITKTQSYTAPSGKFQVDKLFFLRLF